MGEWIKLSLLLAFFVMPPTNASPADFDPGRLAAVIKAYEVREDGGGKARATEAHVAWLMTAAGKAEAAWLAQHYEKLPTERRAEMAMELARTGQVEMVPYLKKALADSAAREEALRGMLYGCLPAEGTGAFRQGLAPEVALLCTMESDEQADAIGLLPYLDPELAAKTLLTDAFLAPGAEFALETLQSLNDAQITIPLARIESLLASWQSTGTNPDSKYELRHRYCEAVKALVVHDPQRAVALAIDAEKLVRRDGVLWSEVILPTEGLTGLEDAIGASAEDPARFAALPEPAQLFYAVSYFDGDCANGGISQALGNSTGDYLPLVRKGYEAMGCKRSLRWLDWMCQPFGRQGPAPVRAERVRQMEAMKPAYRELEKALQDTWNGSNPPADESGNRWLRAQYAVKHAGVLKLIVELEKKRMQRK